MERKKPQKAVTKLGIFVAKKEKQMSGTLSRLQAAVGKEEKEGAEEIAQMFKDLKLSILNIGLGKEREYFFENLSTLVSGGMPIVDALNSIEKELRSRCMKDIVNGIKIDIESGSPLWIVLAKTKLFPKHAIVLLRLGEESGRLLENLNVIAKEQEKDRSFKSKIRAAMLYPAFVIFITAILGTGVAWFILPKLALVFANLRIELPFITKVLIGIGSFLGVYGQYAVPLVIIFVLLFLFFIFYFSKTKFIGQYILFSTPGINAFIKEAEISRFGYLLGTLLETGLPITQALDSLANATDTPSYKKLYLHLRDSVEDGNNLQKSFALFKQTNRLIPGPIEQLIITGENSGTLSGTLLKIGRMFEEKTDTTTKNLTAIFEVVLLIIVWLGVVIVVFAVILPIYSLIGGFNPRQ